MAFFDWVILGLMAVGFMLIALAWQWLKKKLEKFNLLLIF